ncbi:MAG: hypothetical protein F7B20_05610 [Aeropyrum sp.]|nr:hypothetical protein [Aeropyrum sp.]
MKRYIRPGPKRGTRPRLRRYVRDPLPGIEVSIEYVDEVLFPKIDRRLKRGERLWPSIVLGKYGDPKIIHVPVKYAKVHGRLVKRTQSVIDIAFRCDKYGNCRLSTLEIKGIRGWDPLNPERVELPRGYDFLRRKKYRSQKK